MPAGSTETSLSAAHREQVATQLPVLGLIVTFGTLLWFAFAELAAPKAVTAPRPFHNHLAVLLAQILLFGGATAVCRRRPTGGHVMPVAVGVCLAMGLLKVVILTTTATMAAMAMCAIVALLAAPPLVLTWGRGPQLAFQGGLDVAWIGALLLLPRHLPVVEFATAIAFGNLVALVLAEWGTRGFRVAALSRLAAIDFDRRLAASRDAYRALAENAGDFIWAIDLEGRWTYVNETLARRCGRTPQSMIGESVRHTLTDHPLQPDPAALIASVIGGKDVEPQVLQMKTADGPCWVEAVSTPVYGPGGAVIGIQGASRDVTERRLAEEALRTSEERYRGLVESQLELVTRFDCEGNLRFANDSYFRAFRHPRDTVVGHNTLFLVHPNDRDEAIAVFRAAMKPPYRSRRESRALTASGWRWFEWELSGVRDANGRVVEVQQIGRDVTARHESEERLRESIVDLKRSEEKLRLLAQHQVAIREEERKRLSFDLHDGVCQDLVGIEILLESVAVRLGAAPEGVVSDLSRSTRYLKEVVDHLRVMARDLQPMLLHDFGLEGSLRALAMGLSSATTTVCAVFATGIPRLEEADEVAVYRVAQEAILNAIRHAAALNVTMTLTADEAWLKLEVRDDGRGFDVACGQTAHALGLASMEARAQTLAGRLAVESRRGEGSTIRLDCPMRLRSSASAA